MQLGRHAFVADVGSSESWPVPCCTLPKNHRVHALGRPASPAERIANAVEEAVPGAWSPEEADRLARDLLRLSAAGLVTIAGEPERPTTPTPPAPTTSRA